MERRQEIVRGAPAADRPAVKRPPVDDGKHGGQQQPTRAAGDGASVILSLNFLLSNT
jgi:hypothetical protein